MEGLFPVGIAVSLVLIIFLALRGYNILVIGPVCALLVIVTNRMDVVKVLAAAPTSYMMGFGMFIAKYFLIFLLGSLLAKYMEDSGAARAIANKILKMTGTEKPYTILVAIFIIGSVLTYGGVNLYVAMFAIVPLARPLFREMNLPWHLFMVPICLGLATWTMTMLPGTPSIQNAIPSTALGTTLMAAPAVGIVGSIVAVAFGLWYMKKELKKAVQSDQHYVVSAADDAKANVDNLPSVAVSLCPLLVLITIIFVGSVMKIPNLILIALLLSIIIAAVLFNNHIAKHSVTLNAGANSAVTPAIYTAAAVGFGIVVAAAPGFAVISKWILAIPGSPLFSLAAATSLMAAVTGSSTGSLGIIMEAFAKQYLAQGISPEVIHRIATMGSGPLSAMPHSGAVLTLLAITGLKHSEAYRHIFMTVVVGGLLALAASLAVAIAI